MRIGIDIGRVIIGGDGSEDTSFFSDNYLKTPQVAGAWNAIASLSHDHELHIISKCGPVVEEKSIRWLKAHSFIEAGTYTELIRTHRLHFVRKRTLKAPMAQALELDIFIDDRQDIIDSMQGIVAYPILFESWEQTNKRLEEIFNDNT